MRCVEDHTARTGRPDFTLNDLYAFEARLSALHPANRHVRAKIRQQLQVLRAPGSGPGGLAGVRGPAGEVSRFLLPVREKVSCGA